MDLNQSVRRLTPRALKGGQIWGVRWIDFVGILWIVAADDSPVHAIILESGGLAAEWGHCALGGRGFKA